MVKDHIAIILARGGSKRLPNKNILDFYSKPMIAWTIEAALAATCVGRVIVSTDCSEIAQCALDWGADVPLLRPYNLSTDVASSTSALLHAISSVDQHPFTALLQPTSPLRTACDIDRSYGALESSKLDACLSVTKVQESPWLMHVMKSGNVCERILPEISGGMRRQDLPVCYRANGAIYLLRTESFLEKQSLAPETFVGYEIEESRALDIDTEEDLNIIKKIFNVLMYILL